MAPLESRTDPVITPVAVWPTTLESERSTTVIKSRKRRVAIIVSFPWGIPVPR
jgi:hypothetical protein